MVINCFINAKTILIVHIDICFSDIYNIATSLLTFFRLVEFFIGLPLLIISLPLAGYVWFKGGEGRDFNGWGGEGRRGEEFKILCLFGGGKGRENI